MSHTDYIIFTLVTKKEDIVSRPGVIVVLHVIFRTLVQGSSYKNSCPRYFFCPSVSLWSRVLVQVVVVIKYG